MKRWTETDVQHSILQHIMSSCCTEFVIYIAIVLLCTSGKWVLSIILPIIDKEHSIRLRADFPSVTVLRLISSSVRCLLTLDNGFFCWITFQKSIVKFRIFRSLILILMGYIEREGWRQTPTHSAKYYVLFYDSTSMNKTENNCFHFEKWTLMVLLILLLDKISWRPLPLPLPHSDDINQTFRHFHYNVSVC